MSRSTPETRGNSADGDPCVRLLLTDDQPRVRQSLEALFTALHWTPTRTEPLIRIVGAAANGAQAVAQVRALQPDVVVLDLHAQAADAGPSGPPALNRLATIRSIKRQWPAVRVVVLTLYATDRAEVLRAGADAFLLKGCPMRELLAALVPAAT
jgi:DNA-binding NarL/FixJ family response regulator